MAYKRILTIQDISCVGQCSLTVALPIISACGIEACVLPSAVLSTHTAGFTGYTFRDLTEDMPKIKEHWSKENIKFDALYTGYLGSLKQISYVKELARDCLKDGAKLIVDPAMADNGQLYTGFDSDYVAAMKTLCAEADYIIPNLTEACLLTDTEYKPCYERKYIEEIIEKLCRLGCKSVIFTGVSFRDGFTGVMIFEKGEYTYYEHELLPNSCHGTGDIYASAFVGAYTRGSSAYEAAKIAADYTLACIKETADEPNHWYGAKFEPTLGKLIDMINDA